MKAILVCVIISLLVGMLMFSATNSNLQKQSEAIRRETQQLETENAILRQRVDELRLERDVRQEELLDKLEQWLEVWQIDEFEATFYSPFDDVSGLNHDGNPNVTASGYTPGPEIYAVDFDVIPPHSRMWVEGEGWGIAGDTGGAIKGNRIDIYRDTYRHAMADGRQEVTAIYMGVSE